MSDFRSRFEQEHTPDQYRFFLDFSRKVEDKIGHRFSHGDYLLNSLTGCSPRLSRIEYERMEYLGDAILQSITGIALYDEYKDAAPSELTKKRTHYVKNETLAKISTDIFEINELSQELEKGRLNAKNAADVFESIVGAVFLDNNKSFDKSFDIILKFFTDNDLLKLDEHPIFGLDDPKSYLENLARSKYSKNMRIDYVRKNTGTANNPNFEGFVVIRDKGKDDVEYYSGESSGPYPTIKQLEKEAARIAIEDISGK